MCSPYAGDFDGDEMTLIPVADEISIEECKSFRWKYNKLSDLALHIILIPNNSIVVGSGFNNMCIGSTICWSDRMKRGFKITDAHKA
jgi:hypothetical protein